MERAIVAFRQDDVGAWVAELSCLHAQHVRHQPPFRLAPWVLDDVVGRDALQPIPPQVEHRLEPLGEVRFSVEFLQR